MVSRHDHTEDDAAMRVSAGSARRTLVVVGPTPPPVGGQTVMVDLLLQDAASYDDLRLSAVRTRFSRRLNESGLFSLYKVWHLVWVIVRVTMARLRAGRGAWLYLTPAGPTRMAMLRDLVLLLAVRWQFSGLVLHFHAAGMPQAYQRLPRPLRRVFRTAYGSPDLVIAVAPSGTLDGAILGARRTVMVPNGVADLGPARHREVHTPARLLFMGLVTPTKGVGELIEALRLLVGRGLDVWLTLAGEVPESYRDVLAEQIASAGLQDRVRLPGVVSGDRKRALFADSDVFCFPSYFESESFGMVVAEAMSAGVPVVATRWRGIPYVVGDGDAGLLVDPHDVAALADAVERLLSDAALRSRIVERARERYEALFTIEAHLAAMRGALRLQTEAEALRA
jgi:glycosyltransferase involved in cell wall biosynthesis